MLGSQERARQQMAEIVRFAARTPFEIPGLMEAAGATQADAIKQGIVEAVSQNLKDLHINIGEIAVKQLIEAKTDEALKSQLDAAFNKLETEVNNAIARAVRQFQDAWGDGAEEAAA